MYRLMSALRNMRELGQVRLNSPPRLFQSRRLPLFATYAAQPRFAVGQRDGKHKELCLTTLEEERPYTLRHCSQPLQCHHSTPTKISEDD